MFKNTTESMGQKEKTFNVLFSGITKRLTLTYLGGAIMAPPLSFF